jgi:hypothetical protein
METNSKLLEVMLIQKFKLEMNLEMDWIWDVQLGILQETLKSMEHKKILGEDTYRSIITLKMTTLLDYTLMQEDLPT